MGPQRFDPNQSPSCDQIAACKVVIDLFLELFQLLEDYSPMWYDEQLRNRALAARSALNACDKQRPLPSA